MISLSKKTPKNNQNEKKRETIKNSELVNWKRFINWIIKISTYS